MKLLKQFWISFCLWFPCNFWFWNKELIDKSNSFDKKLLEEFNNIFQFIFYLIFNLCCNILFFHIIYTIFSFWIGFVIIPWILYGIHYRLIHFDQ
jgi:hypothetical protein